MEFFLVAKHSLVQLHSSPSLPAFLSYIRFGSKDIDGNALDLQDAGSSLVDHFSSQTLVLPFL